jgi:hypothetical protein
MMTTHAPVEPAIGEATANAEDPYVADRYFTDGFSLFRLVGWLRRTREPALCELEDCHTLHCVLIERELLLGLSLRPVGP